MSQDYNHQTTEEKWLKRWEETGLFQNSNGQTGTGPKQYLLFAFAYPSGAGLHVGHVESNTALDILARYSRMQGMRVFFPVGWDAFGLPAENYAIKTGVPPAVTTKKAIETFERQVKRLGISYDWATEIATSHPEYYKWTQWLFLQLYKKGLAYKAMGKVNWCPSCQTVLANEQVVNGRCERCGTEVIQKDLEQWYFKITRYAEELISGLDQVDWPEPTKQQQLNWIGKKEGAKVRFPIVNTPFSKEIEVFTTRVDTIFGVTFLVISPEMARAWEKAGWQMPDPVKAYVEKAFHKTEEERRVGEKEKTGVDTGVKAVNPVSGEDVPVWVADYVLAEYGTGAVMGVPAHDQRDHDFAAKMGLPIRKVIESFGLVQDKLETPPVAGQAATSEYGVLVNSGEFSGMTSEEAMVKIPEKFAVATEKTTMYKLRDWLISRQRYWGAPIPVVYDPEGKPHPVKEEHLPWLLPTDVEFKPTGKSPLTYSMELVERTERLYGQGWRPEYDTMDTFVDSSWYYLRYTDARNSNEFAGKAQLQKWLPVDFYMIGPEHIVLHLLYSRFFTKFLRDEGYLAVDEPFLKMRHQGMILGPDHRKMSKSKGNVITPDEIIEQYGADTLRLYEMFMGPIEADKPWDPRAVNGVYRFLQRMWKLLAGEVRGTLGVELQTKLSETMVKVGEDLGNLKFNTAIAALMELTNAWEAAVKIGQDLTVEDKRRLTLVLAPLAPFMAEEVWEWLGGEASVHQQAWPTIDTSVLTAKPVLVVVQVNGKVRTTLAIEPQKVEKDSVVALAQADPKIEKWLDGKDVRKVVWVAPTEKRQGLVNFVV